MDNVITWRAEERIERKRGAWWYVVFFVIVTALLGLAIWTRQWTFVALVVVSVVAIGVYIYRGTKQIEYVLSNDEWKEDTRVVPLADFKAFGVIQEGSRWQIVLLPKSRVGVKTTALIPEDKGEAIVDYLGARLPMVEVSEDWLDRVTRVLKI